MGWGEWMVPEIDTEAEFRLRAHELEIREAAEVNADAVAHLTVQLLWQTRMQESIITKATKRIAELEAREAVQQAVTDDQWMEIAREIRPLPWWLRRLLLMPAAVLARSVRQ